MALSSARGNDFNMTDNIEDAGGVDAGAPETTKIDPRLLEILVCPLTKSSLDYDRTRQELISRSAKLAYPIRDGIPIMLPEEARPID
jgi:uncharacterized protein